MLSSKVKNLQPSSTLSINTKVQELLRQGKKVINLGVGEPDFPTPTHIKEAAIAAMQAEYTKYTAPDGILALKQAIIAKFKRDNALEYTLAQVMVSSGAKQCLYNALQVLLEPADLVLIPIPYWTSYPDMVTLAGGQCSFIPTSFDSQYKITPQQLASAITPQTKVLILNSPNNPTGAVYTKSELIALGQVIVQHPHLVVLSDDIYEYLYWGEQPFINLATALPKVKAQCLIVNGVSKSHAMTGWRIGFAAGPEIIIKAMGILQSHCTSNPCSIAQYAAVAALNGPPYVALYKELKTRHDYLIEQLKLPGIKCFTASGGLYVWCDASDFIKSLNFKDDLEFAHHLLDKYLAIVPGSAFGAPGSLRFSLAAPIAELQMAAEVIRELSSH